MLNVMRHHRLNVVLQIIFYVSGLMFSAAVQADEIPRYLNTDFDAYKKQQAVHDQALMSTKNNTTTPINTPQSIKTQQALAASPVKPASKKPKKSESTAHSAGVININQADETMMMQSLNGIGAVKAKAIVDYRNSNGKFKQPNDLLMVKGIGAATLAKNQALLRFD